MSSAAYHGTGSRSRSSSIKNPAKRKRSRTPQNKPRKFLRGKAGMSLDERRLQFILHGKLFSFTKTELRNKKRRYDCTYSEALAYLI